MRRLVYSPKAFVYVKDENKQVHDISRYVVEGSVRRKVSDVSKAEIVVRNPNFKWTSPAKFKPMDPITIYLMRIKNRPVRVFSGFIDNVQYYQMYPGTITITASCTLKKLLYTFFDPALPYTTSFLRQYGWYSTGHGFAINPDQLSAKLPGAEKLASGTHSLDPSTAANAPNALTDSSIGNLLFATMKWIGGWDPKDLYIENLPSDLGKRLAQIYTDIEKTSKQEQDAWANFMKDVIGTTTLSGSSGPSSSGSSGPTGPGQVVGASFYSGDQGSCGPLSGMAFAELDNGTALGNLPCGAKIKITYKGKSIVATKEDIGGGGDTVQGHKRAIDLWLPLAQALNFDMSAGVDLVTWEKTGGPVMPSGDPHGGAPGAGHAGSVGGNLTFPMPSGIAVDSSSWSLDQGVDIATNGGACGSAAPLLAVEDGTVSYVPLSGFTNGWGIPILHGSSGNNYYYGHAGDGGQVNGGHGGPVHAGDKIGEVGCGAVGISTGPHLEIGLADSSGNPLGSQTASQMEQMLKTGKVVGSPGGSPGSSGGGSGGGNSGIDPVVAGKAASFAAAFEWPTAEATVLAEGLQGQKSLMNDKPLLPFIQQLTNACLRQFQSMPDGSFFAFYPDYFGEFFHRKPYWLIDDIEILDGGIRLNDEQLATHSYVVGDTLGVALTGGAISTPEKLGTGGVITIYNAWGSGMLDTKSSNEHITLPTDSSSPSVEAGGSPIMTNHDANEFLQRYGPRPLYAEEPMVRSIWFEAFMAYQQFMQAWSRQFVTQFEFTFMPELYPGGHVGFPDHGLQMYVEEVYHTFSYEEGFSTAATLSSPSVLRGRDGQPVSNTDLPPNMINALVPQAPIPIPPNPFTSSSKDKKGHSTTLPTDQ